MVINMKLPKKLLALLVAAMCAVLAAGGCNPQKTPDYGINPVALSVNGVDITLFDFDRFKKHISLRIRFNCAAAQSLRLFCGKFRHRA